VGRSPPCACLAEVDGAPAGAADDVLRTTASAGVASLGGLYDTLEVVIAQVDEALNAAKRAGRDRVAA
jgi:PleD family two-component response regulator